MTTVNEGVEGRASIVLRLQREHTRHPASMLSRGYYYEFVISFYFILLSLSLSLSLSLERPVTPQSRFCAGSYKITLFIFSFFA